MRMGWFRPVHVKTLPAQEIRALLTGRKMLQKKLKDVELGIRGLLRALGLKVEGLGRPGSAGWGGPFVLRWNTGLP